MLPTLRFMDERETKKEIEKLVALAPKPKPPAAKKPEKKAAQKKGPFKPGFALSVPKSHFHKKPAAKKAAKKAESKAKAQAKKGKK